MACWCTILPYSIHLDVALSQNLGLRVLARKARLGFGHQLIQEQAHRLYESVEILGHWCKPRCFTLNRTP